MSYAFVTTKAFERDLRGIISRVPSELLEKTFHCLEQNPHGYPGMLDTQTLKRAGKSKRDLWKSKVGQAYRVLWRYEDAGSIFLLRIGAEKMIDDVVDVPSTEVKLEFVKPWARDEAKEDLSMLPKTREQPKIFAAWKPTHLELLGVPEAEVGMVQALSDIEEVYNLGLPEYAAKNLVDAFLQRDSWVPDQLFDSSQIFYRTNADQLEGYCKGEIKQLLLNLSREQDSLVTMNTTGPTLIRGIAGSGKTTVGVYRAMRQASVRTLFEQSTSPQVLFITYTETLARVVEQMFKELYGPRRACCVEVWVLDEWLRTYLEAKPAYSPVGDKGELETCIALGILKASRSYPDSRLLKRGNGFFESEIRDVIKGRGLTSWEEYRDAHRIGRKRGLGEGDRRVVWTVYEEYQRQLGGKGRFDYLDLALCALREIPLDKSFRPYDSVVLDEAQDLCPVQLHAVSLLAGGPTARNLVLLADPTQSIYYKGVPWKEGKIQIAGARSFSLGRNFRNTRQILQAAWTLTRSGASEDPDEKAIRPELSDRYGPKPEIVYCLNSEYEDRFIVETITHLCAAMRYRPGDIAVLARRKDIVDHYAKLLERARIPVVHFRDDDFDIFENDVKVITFNSAKGLEFPVVFLAAFNEGELPRRIYTEDEEELASEVRSERRLGYVGMTRAAQRLFIVCSEHNASSFLNEVNPETVRRIHYEGPTKRSTHQ